MSTLQARLSVHRRSWDAHFDAVALRRAERGAQKLERDRPGSVAALDLKKLNIGNGKVCALGQTYGSFNAAPRHLNDWFLRVQNGFFAGLFVHYDRLNRAWQQVVPRYRKAAA